MSSPVKIWRNQSHISKLLGRDGKLVTWTVVYVPPAGHEQSAPYAVGIVEVSGGKRVTVQIVDCDPNTLRPGLHVRLVLRKSVSAARDEVIPYGIKAVPHNPQ